jgi:oligoendopeptidase F
MAPVLESTDRAEREAAWRLVGGRRMADREKLDKIFDEMKALRLKIAANAGFANYRDYVHQAKDRFDYTPEDCFTFHAAVEQTVVPLLRKRRAQRREALGVETLRPWDLGVDPAGAARLQPFEQAEELEEKCQAIFEGLSGSLGGIFAEMRQRRLLDLDSRVGKAPGGYQCTLGEVRLPFIFMNAAGTNRDVFTLLHEGGHAFHAYAARQEPLIAYRHAPMEFCEVASMAMEMFAMDRLEVFYPDEADKRRARERHLDDLLGIFPWIATVDAFQQWIYLNPEHTVEQRQAKFVELEERFSPEVDWSGLEAEHRSMWHRQLHIFELPFYYIEYGIAQLGALQLWTKFRDEPAATLEGYLRGLALGGARPLPELFEAAGIRFDFSAATMGPLFEAVGGELGV